MKELLWSLFNVASIAFFLYVLLGFLAMGRKIFEGKLKGLSIVVLVLGVVQLTTARNSEELNKTVDLANDFDPQSPSLVTHHAVQDDLSLNFDLSVTYRAENNELIPVQATGDISGFILGYDYEFIAIQTEVKDRGEKARYSASGILHWKLFGIPVYNQYKKFSGEI